MGGVMARIRDGWRGGAAALLLLQVGCSGGLAEQPAEAGPRDIVVRTFDYGFDAPDTIPGGATRIRLINDGPDFHHVWLVRLEDGRTVDDLVTQLAGHGPLPSWAVAVGGPNTPGAPGEETSAVVDLEPGSYALVCVIPGMHDGEYHVMKGMVRPLTVVASQEHGLLPEPDLTMTLDDYRFDLSEPIRAGLRTIRVENAALQPHEVVVVRLEDGRTAQDFLAFLQEPVGEPPGTMMGGVTWLGTGEANLVTLAFESGAYALLCFVPDAGDGRLHLAHGMIREFTVE